MHLKTKKWKGKCVIFALVPLSLCSVDFEFLDTEEGLLPLGDKTVVPPDGY